MASAMCGKERRENVLVKLIINLDITNWLNMVSKGNKIKWSSGP